MRFFLFLFLLFSSITVFANCQNDDLYCYVLSNIDFQSQFAGVSLVLISLIFVAVIIYSLSVILEFIVISPYELYKKANEDKFDDKYSLEEKREENQMEEQDFGQQEEENKEVKS
jgi:hypothetical protein